MNYDADDWWDRAVQRNRAALLCVVTLLFGFTALDEGGGVDYVPRRVARRILRLLRPAESAARRLIVVVARGIRVDVSKLRPGKAPEGPSGLEAAGLLVIHRNVDFGLARFWRPEDAAAPKKPAPSFPAFPLADPAHRFDVLGWNGLRPFPKDGFAPVDPDKDIPARALCRRVQALKDALDNLPRYAERLARREARIKLASGSMDNGREAPIYRRRTLRLGHPPGHCPKPEREVDDLLRECHQLALEAMAKRGPG